MIQFAAMAASAAVGVGKAIAGEIAAATTKTTGATQTGTTTGTAIASAKAKKTATEFEKMFLEQSFDRLTKSEGTDGPMGENGTGGDVYRSMLTKEYAGQVVKSGGVGIADQVYKEMMKMQEASGAGKA